MRERRIVSPIEDRSSLRDLDLGDIVYLDGTILTMRDKATRRLLEYLDRDENPPFDLEGFFVYHCGPLVSPDGRIISAGPTTSTRMSYAIERILETGIAGFIGKGGFDKRAPRGGYVYLHAIGGCGSLYASRIIRVRGRYWEDLGEAESIWILEVRSFGPLVVTIDYEGRELVPSPRML